MSTCAKRSVRLFALMMVVPLLLLSVMGLGVQKAYATTFTAAGSTNVTTAGSKWIQLPVLIDGVAWDYEANPYLVTYTSSNDDVAYPMADDEIVAIYPGTATVTATLGTTGQTVKFNVTVNSGQFALVKGFTYRTTSIMKNIPGYASGKWALSKSDKKKAKVTGSTIKCKKSGTIKLKFVANGKTYTYIFKSVSKSSVKSQAKKDLKRHVGTKVVVTKVSYPSNGSITVKYKYKSGGKYVKKTVSGFLNSNGKFVCDMCA